VEKLQVIVHGFGVRLLYKGRVAKMLTVAKFGGSSLSNRAQFEKVKGIVKDDDNRKIVVVSALGKREKSDSKMTDLLFLIAAHIKHDVNYDSLWDVIVSRFVSVKAELKLNYDIEADLADLRRNLDAGKITEDHLVSRGEYFTAKLVSEYLGYEFVDAREVIAFKANGDIDLDVCKERLEKRIVENSQVVVPGFYGAFVNGKIKLLNRGGSDITAAIIASCLGADKYENWTDVNGVLMADPRIVDNPVPVAQLTYEELSELSYMGANVLHEETIYPIRGLNIPIHIKNTNDPTATGTIISDMMTEPRGEIAGISGKQNFIAINIFKNKMSTEVGFLKRTLAIFERFHLNIEHVPTGIDHVGIILAEKEVGDNLYDLIEALQTELGADDVTYKEKLSLITIVGRGIIANAHVQGVVFSTLGNAQIRVQLIAQSPREINMIIGVHNDDYVRAISSLYDGLTDIW